MISSMLLRPCTIANPARGALRHVRGFTLIELLIAMTLGLMVLVGVTTLVMNTGKANREQAAIARLQENGRFALNRISADLRMAGSQYCTSFANGLFPADTGNPLRPFHIDFDGAMPWGLPRRTTVGPGMPPVGQAWLLSPRFFLQGHECTVAACNPVLNTIGAAVPVIPSAGLVAGAKAGASDALTVRYLNGPGSRLSASHAFGSTPLSLLDPITLAPGDLALATSCSRAEVFAAAPVTNGLTVTSTGNGVVGNAVGTFAVENDSRVFNFTQSFLTVSYFLRLRANADGGANISTLVRQQNGQIQPIADGVERLEFLYGVRANAAGVPQYQFLTADQVQNGVAGLNCFRRPPGIQVLEAGCLWRQVESIDVALLVNTVTDAAATPTELFSFSAAVPPLVDAVPPPTLPSGLPRGRMFRKEFRTRVNIRSFTQ